MAANLEDMIVNVDDVRGVRSGVLALHESAPGSYLAPWRGRSGGDTIAVSGIAGSVITGVIAVVAVWTTIRHELRLGDAQELQRALIRMRATTYRLRGQRPQDTRHPQALPKLRSILDESLESVATIEPLALRPAPELAADLEAQSMELIRMVNGPAPSQEIVDGLAALTS